MLLFQKNTSELENFNKHQMLNMSNKYDMLGTN